MKRLLFVVAAMLFAGNLMGQNADGLTDNGKIQKYRRSSLYTVLITHSKQDQGTTIKRVFMSLPTPDKFNNHDLGIKAFESSVAKPKKKASAKRDQTNLADIEAFINKNDIARKMIAKWFNRDANGNMDVDLLVERGMYSAQLNDIDEAQNSAYGIMSLGDQGEELIGKTFLLVNDITYADKGEKSAKAAGALRFFGALLGGITGTNISDLTDMAADGINEIDGFGVNISSYLFRLDWNEDMLNTLYATLWLDENVTDEAKRRERINAFDLSDIFKLTYVGSTSTTKGFTASKSFSKKSEEQQMAVACGRALDESILNLQREFDEFKVSVPIMSINQNARTCEVAIGLKEGINEKSKFEVLMQIENEDGTISYNRIGTIEPIAGKIWDNRYGALEIAEAYAADGQKAKKEEGVADGNAYLKATTFKITSGSDRIYPGCLVREIKIQNTTKRK